MDYIEKLEDLLSQKYTYREIAENLYLNYHSVIDTDEVYRIRKKLSEVFMCNLNDVKLIGSAHTGYTFKNDKLEIRKNPKDYDFAIINASVFIKYFHMVDIKKIERSNLNTYSMYILEGKLHPLYADRKFLKVMEKIYLEVANDLNIERHITVCFYLSEKAFIEGLVQYNHKLYNAELKKVSQKMIEDVPEMVLKEVPKMEG